MPESELRALLESLEKRMAALETRLDKEDEDQWKRLNGFQDKLDTLAATIHILNTSVVRIEAGLGERCVTRGNEIEALKKELGEMKARVWTFSGAAAVLAILGQIILKKMWP